VPKPPRYYIRVLILIIFRSFVIFKKRKRKRKKKMCEKKLLKYSENILFVEIKISKLINK
jgi:hypothetical protein